MAEDIKDIEKEDGAVKEPEVDAEIKEPDVATVTPGLKGPSPGVLEKIASVFRKPKVEESEDKPEGEVDDTTGVTTEATTDDTSDKTDGVTAEVTTDIEYEQIDQRFVDAAATYGWSRERIIEYADNHDDMDVIEMTTRMEKSIKDNRTSNDTVSDDSFINEEAFKTLAEKDENLAQAVRDILDPLAKRFENTSSELNTLKGTLGDYESDRKAQDSIRDMEIANGVFDNSGVSALGKTKDIPKYPDGSYDLSDPVVQEREKVWGVAQQFYANGGTFESAMKNAMQWYHGSNANKDIKHKIIKDLKEQEERIMPKRQESKVEKEYASDEERKAAVINDAVRKYNIEFPS